MFRCAGGGRDQVGRRSCFLLVKWCEFKVNLFKIAGYEMVKHKHLLK